MTRITGERRTKHLKRIGIVLLVMGLIIIAGGVSQYFRDTGASGDAALQAGATVRLVVPLIIGLFVCGFAAIPLLVVRAERKKAESG